MAVAATGSRKPDRRAARLLPGLRLRCCDKAVLPSAMHSGAGAQGADRCGAGQRVALTALGVLPGPAPGGARAHGPSALSHRRYLARRTGGIPENSRKKLCRAAPPPSAQITERQYVSAQLPSVIFPAVVTPGTAVA